MQNTSMVENLIYGSNNNSNTCSG